MNGTTERYGLLAGRVLMSLIFLISGWSKVTGWSGMVGMMASKGLPLPELLMAGAVFAELAGGLSLLLGFKARWGALGLFLFLIPATLLFHNFWAVPAEQQQAQMSDFLKNLALMGGLVYVAVVGAPAPSLDAVLERHSTAAPGERARA